MNALGLPFAVPHADDEQKIKQQEGTAHDGLQQQLAGLVQAQVLVGTGRRAAQVLLEQTLELAAGQADRL